MKWVVTTAPTEQPISEDQLKTHLRIIGEAEGSEHFALLIATAVDYAQEKISCSLCEQTMTATFYDGEFTGGILRLPRGPIIDVVSVADANGAITDFTIYRVGNSDRLLLNVAATAPVTVEYSAGYGAAEDVPAAIRQALLTHCGTLYENRESVITGTIVASVPNSLEDFYRLRARTKGVA